MVEGDRVRGSGWKSELMSLLATKGRVTAPSRRGRTKPVSNRTQDAREVTLFLCFNQLEEMGMKIRTLSGFKEKHVKALMSRWESEGLGASTLQNRLSCLRTLSVWLGKTGMVGPSDRYVSDPRRVRRKASAQFDHSWKAAGVDADRLIQLVSAFDAHVGLQLRLCHAFYLRKEEAVMFRPFQADRGHYIVVRDGTKGGRERTVTVESDYQRGVLEQAKRMAKTPSGHVGKPGLTLVQALNRFSYVVRKFGVSKDGLGITPHGLRHEGLNDLYERVAGVPSPVRQVSESGPADPVRMKVARYRVSQDAGHARESISGAYLGSMFRKPVQLDDEQRARMDRWTRYFELSAREAELDAEEREVLLGLKRELVSELQPSG